MWLHQRTTRQGDFSCFIDAYNGMLISLRQYKAQEVKGGLGKGGQLPVGK